MTDPYSVINDPELTVVNGAGTDAWGIGPLHPSSAHYRVLDTAPTIEDVETSYAMKFVAVEAAPIDPVLPVTDDEPEES